MRTESVWVGFPASTRCCVAKPLAAAWRVFGVAARRPAGVAVAWCAQPGL